jgi:hypothetical protein
MKSFNYRNFSEPLLPRLSFMFIVEEIASRHFITLMVPFREISKSTFKAKLSGADVIKLFCPYITDFGNKLERLSLESFSSLD